MQTADNSSLSASSLPVVTSARQVTPGIEAVTLLTVEALPVLLTTL